MPVLFQDDFQSFPIGPLPFDREHSAMGEYHYAPNAGYAGQWYDPICNCFFRGPSWLVTALDGAHYMEQTRLRNPLTRDVCSVLAAGDERWDDYTMDVKIRCFTTEDQNGVMVRYQTSLMHYACFLSNNKAQCWKIEKKNRTLLAQAEFPFDSDSVYAMRITCKGDTLSWQIDGKDVLTVKDETYKTGKIALGGYMPTQYTDVRVECTQEAYARYIARKTQDEERLAKKRARYAQPKLHKVIDLKNFGASRQIRFGHLLGGNEWFFVMAQHQKRVFKERYTNISCLTAVSMETGKILWQIGEPSTLAVQQDTTCDLPFQIYDIDGDGYDEVIVAKDFKLMILNGRTGEVIREMDTPRNTDAADEILGIEFKKHAFDRLNVDAIRIVNVSGNARPSDIMIKDRYARLWVYDKDFNLLWKFCHNNTGHFPYAYDYDGDGKDEIFSCYNMIGSDGTLKWKLPIDTDHTDEIIYGKIDPDRDEILAIVSGWEGFMLVSRDGEILVRDVNGHGQRISAANYAPERRGLEICTTTYWENQGIIYLYDCKGNELWHMEPSTNGNIIAPVNWQGDGTELILLNGNVKLGGMLDGDGDRVVMFPDDGHADMCAEVINMTGDARDEIVLWDATRMYIYTQDRPCEITDREYIPEKYPHYNSSNYRGEYSYAKWREREPSQE